MSPGLAKSKSYFVVSPYRAFVLHFGMTPRTIAVGESHQNGDVDASNGVLKRRLEKHLLLRGSRDFECVPAYERWIEDRIVAANRLREEKLREELSVMRALPANRFPEYVAVSAPVTSWGTVRIKNNIYSVPSRLSREEIRAHVYDDRVEIFHGGVLQMSVERLLGRSRHRINYRHLIHSLVRKPGAFRRYRYREELFPSAVFRRAYERLCDDGRSEYKADLEYLRILRLAADTLESSVEEALLALEHGGRRPAFDEIEEIVSPKRSEIPDMPPAEVDLTSYDRLLASLLGGGTEAEIGSAKREEVMAS